MSNKPIIYIVDDVPDQLEMLSQMLISDDYETKCYNSGHDFLNQENINEIGCLLLDNNMPGFSGLEVQVELNRLDCQLPIVFMSGVSIYSDIVKAVQKGALGFLQKPFSKEELLATVKQSIAESLVRQEKKSSKIKHNLMINSLTPRENQVYDLVIAGHTNRVISAELSITLGTVEFHRANLMKKLNVSTLADLMAISLLNK